MNHLWSMTYPSMPRDKAAIRRQQKQGNRVQRAPRVGNTETVAPSERAWKLHLLPHTLPCESFPLAIPELYYFIINRNLISKMLL